MLFPYLPLTDFFRILNLLLMYHKKIFLPVKILLTYIIVLAVFFSLARPVLAQLEIVEMYDLADESAQSGDILTIRDGAMVPSNVEYDSKIFGVIQTEALAVYRRVDGSGTAVTRSGNAVVNVTDRSGAIKKGDFVTTSTLPGKGQKAIASGYVLGVALEDLAGSEGKIPVAIRVEFAELSSARNASRLFDSINTALFRNTQDPAQFVNIVKYIGVSAIDIVTIMIGLLILARVIPKGVEGIGRNPTARHSIVVYTVVNLGIVVLVVMLGVGLSFFLLRF